MAHTEHRRVLAAAEAPLAQMGHEVLKAAALVNGLAAAATLYVLVSWGRETGARWLVPPLSLFGFGFATAMFATGWSYLAAEGRAEALRTARLTAAPPFVAETEASRVAAGRAARFGRLAFAAVLVAMAAAIVGFCTAGVVLLVLLR